MVFTEAEKALKEGVRLFCDDPNVIIYDETESKKGNIDILLKDLKKKVLYHIKYRIPNAKSQTATGTIEDQIDNN